jgi:hypothetical protein
VLNVNHPLGGENGRFFLARGFSTCGWQSFGAVLREYAINNQIESEQETDFGRKLTVRCRIITPDGSNPCIRTVWMVEPDKASRLVTAYPSTD